MIIPSPANEAWDRFIHKGVTIDFESGLDDEGAAIFDIWSVNKRKGEAREAILLLRKKYGWIHVEGVMEDSPIAIYFWKKMLSDGVVDVATQTNGISIQGKLE